MAATPELAYVGMSGEPSWLEAGRRDIGIAEVPGPGDNPKIIQWAKAFGGWISSFFNHDSIPWCALWLGRKIADAGLTVPEQSKLLGALNWRFWGQPLMRAIPGAVLVFQREGGGHVGFYVGESADGLYYLVLGGNQSDKVCIERIAKYRCVAIRWPQEVTPFGAPALVSASGAAISRNEA